MSDASGRDLSLTVVVPTWRRPASLARCLRALAAQARPADEVIVVTRREDEESRVAARAIAMPGATRLVLPEVEQRGVIAGLQAGLDAAQGDCIAFTDDDAEPRADWTERLVATLQREADVGGVGGRDHQPASRDARGRSVVGEVQWFGRVIGAHHLGIGPARDVDVLKGVNVAFRTSPLRTIGFDARLRGEGAQQHWELGVCLALRRAGWRLVYDPSIAVDHHVEARSGDDQMHRGRFAASAMTDAVHNEALSLLEHLGPVRRLAFEAWSRLAGTVAAPGALNAMRLRLQGHDWAFDAWRAAREGRRLAHESLRAPRARPVERTP